MDFLFQDASELIQRELMRPKIAVYRDYIIPNIEDKYIQFAQICMGDVVGDGVLREYDYADGHPAENGQIQESIDAAENDAEGACS